EARETVRGRRELRARDRGVGAGGPEVRGTAHAERAAAAVRGARETPNAGAEGEPRSRRARDAPREAVCAGAGTARYHARAARAGAIRSSRDARGAALACTGATR